jgi:peptidoglycan-associated lipoprotein
MGAISLSAAGPASAQFANSNTTSSNNPWTRSAVQGQSQFPSPAAQVADRDAAQLYADARADLERSQPAAAQRKFEVLVARYPASPLADVARRDLQQLYAGLSAEPAPATLPPAQNERSAKPPIPLFNLVQPSQIIPPIQPGQQAQRAAPQPQHLRLAADEFRQHAGDRVFFSDSSAELGSRAITALEAQAEWLKRYPLIEVAVEGHSDDHGSREFNRDLAERRARTVKLRLEDLGIPAQRITVAVFGRDQPVADCPEPSCAVHNRRVITTISSAPPLGSREARTTGPRR